MRVTQTVTLFNGITGKPILTIEENCSINKDRRLNQVDTICLTGKDEYVKYSMGLSDNAIYVIQQLKNGMFPPYHERLHIHQQDN